MATVLANGWQLQITIPDAVTGGAYDLGTDSAPAVSVTVTSKSWTAAGVETTLSRVVYGKAVLRKPYPDQSVKDETVSGSDIVIKVVLNDYIYASETVSNVTVSAGFHTDSGSGGSGLLSDAMNEAVTNSSAFAYHKPIAMWLNHDLDWVKANTYNVQMAVAHKDFRNGLPVRAVKFIATDTDLNTTSTTVSTMTKRDFPVTGLSAPVFSADLDFSGLTQGQMVTIDAIIYPWIGDAFQVSIDADTYPSPNLTVLKVLNDRTGDYGTAYAYVDGVGGGTPACNTNPVAAALTPYATVASAAAGLQTYINSTFSRDNVSGGIIRLNVGTHIHSTYSARAVGEIPLIIEPANVGDKATTVYQNNVDSHVSNGITDLLKISNITLRQVSNKKFLDNAGTKDGNFALILEGCIIDANGQSTYSGWVYKTGRTWMLGCSGDNRSVVAYSSSIVRPVIAIGCTSPGVGGVTYQTIGCKSLIGGPGGGVDSVSYTPANYTFHGWNFFSIPTEGSILTTITSNVAFVGNVAEQVGGQVNAAMLVSADNITTPCSNILDIGNTVVGSRSNLLYQDTGAAEVVKTGTSSLSIHYKFNTKSDIFAGNGNLVGNWAFVNRVGSKYRVATDGGSDGTPVGPGSWVGEVSAVGDSCGPLDPHFTDDASFTGSKAGDGDYTPGESTELPQIPAGMTAYPSDLYGRDIPADGTAFVGAVQRIPATTGETPAAMMMGL